MDTEKEKICRICLSQTNIKNMKNLFEDHLVVNFIKELADVEISQNDSLPHYVCCSCSAKIDQALELRQICIDSDEVLRLQLIFKTESELPDQSNNENFGTLPSIFEPVVQFLDDIKSEQDFKLSGDEMDLLNDDKSGSEDDTGSNEDPSFEAEAESPKQSSKDRSSVRKKAKDRTEIYPKPKGPQKTHQCSFCGKTFFTASHLKGHELTHTDNKRFECHLCKKQFLLKSYLNRHLKSHANERNYKCIACGKGFNTSNALSDHFRLVHGKERKFKCSSCDKRFPLKQQMISHTRIHTGEKPNKCHICDKSYSHKIDLKRHIMLHTGIKPYKCPYCERTFTKKSNMACHIPVHTGEKPYRCDICLKEFRQPCPYKKHMKQHSLDAISNPQMPFNGQQSAQSFLANPSLIVHQPQLNQNLITESSNITISQQSHLS